MLFKGSGVALVTPFKDDLSINYVKLEELINFHIANKTDAIIICGTTGESSTLSDEEFKEIVSFCIKKVNKRLPVIVGCGSNNTKRAIEKSKLAQRLGADALLIVTPYYNKCTQEGLYLHYKSINDVVNVPIIIYNVPSRTGVNITPYTVLRLSKLNNIIGIKEASSDISQITKIISLTYPDFLVYSGNDDQTLPILSLGGAGTISVLANIYPNIMHDLCYSFFNNDIITSRNITYKYLEIMKNLFIEVNPMPVKEVMNILGFDVGDCRLPLCRIKEENYTKLNNCIKKLGPEN